ncbi:MAG: cupin domain-containing protein [Kiritimatiellae bacterium]|nr:cupin domain-containing protein [Kiritimatiellia bacterium]
MKLDFCAIPEQTIPRFKGGEGEINTRMYWDGSTRIMRARLAPGCSIGLHRHENNSEAIYILSGRGTATCDGVAEPLAAGQCHFCPMGHEHQLVNDGTEELVFFAVVPTIADSSAS